MDIEDKLFAIWMIVCLAFTVAAIAFIVWFLISLLHAVQGMGS